MMDCQAAAGCSDAAAAAADDDDGGGGGGVGGEVTADVDVQWSRSRCRLFLYQLLTCVTVRPVRSARRRRSTGVG